MSNGYELLRRLPAPVKRGLWRGYAAYCRLTNPVRLLRLRSSQNIKVHLGCGDDRIPGFVNIDCRVTRATDYLIDLNVPRAFGRGALACVYSHAFFEHLYRPQRLPHLKRICEALNPDTGVCCYLGLPYFPAIARMYLDGYPGVMGPVFDLYNVYRYTHGDPDQVPHYWLEQLHKSLFDEQELGRILTGAGFGTAVLFNYCYVGEEKHPLNLGFYATPASTEKVALQAACLGFLGEVARNKVIIDSVRWLD